jgi:hypothetical protein
MNSQTNNNRFSTIIIEYSMTKYYAQSPNFFQQVLYYLAAMGIVIIMKVANTKMLFHDIILTLKAHLHQEQ